MPLLGKKWLLIDDGASGDAPGGILAEEFGPSERLNEAEFKAALVAADAVRTGRAVVIDAKGEARAMEVKPGAADVRL